MKDNEIFHTGVITSISDTIIRVAITSNAACGSCTAKSMCGMTEQKNKYIDISTINGGNNGSPININDFSIGQSVEVYMTTSNGTKAVIYGYLFPFIVLMITLIVMLLTVKTEWLSALVSFAAVGIYYVCLKFFFKKKFEHDFTFSIRNNN